MPARPGVASESSTETLLRQVLDRLDRIEQLLEQRHGRGARDSADRALLIAVAESIGDRRFTSGELMHHATTIAPALHEALRAADVQDPHELGVLFRRLHGVTIDGLIVERTDDSRAGAVWRVRLCEDDRRIGALGKNSEHDD